MWGAIAATVGAYAVLNMMAGVDAMAPLAVALSWSLAVVLGLAMARDQTQILNKIFGSSK
jgi:hypothetical protein